MNVFFMTVAVLCSQQAGEEPKVERHHLADLVPTIQELLQRIEGMQRAWMELMEWWMEANQFERDVARMEGA